MATMWHGRFGADPSESLQALNDSLHFDQRMFRQDIAGSRAHLRMLCEVGLVEPSERDEVLAALEQVSEELSDGSFEFVESDEDIHTAVDRRVCELAEAGAKLHTGRSRNDQVATDLRLWTKSAIDEVVTLVGGLQLTLLRAAESVGDAYLPGYTHLQQAQPVLLAHHLLAHGWALARDVDRLKDARARLDVSPLGAGALAGSSLPLDPGMCADELGFAGVFDNSLDAVSDRDFVAETLFGLSLLGVHLSRIGEELILWASSEFGFVTLDEAFSTGSSMMPQKKNPDVAELARGKAGRLIGRLTGLMTTLKGLPLTYNKDLQEDKEPLFDSVDTVLLTVSALDGMIGSLEFNISRMTDSAASPYAAATDLAEWLVSRGMPFRQAHEVVADLVRRSLDGEGAFADLVAASDALGTEAAGLLEPGVSVTRRNTHGGGSPDAVAEQIQRFRALLGQANLRDRSGGAETR
ncbi:MAG: argininosuccinate lyase [Acidimicrobiaceae bacterium]|nr:argininosuccinate lyase [Acidimicrobiaceae bacterium]